MGFLYSLKSIAIAKQWWTGKWWSETITSDYASFGFLESFESAYWREKEIRRGEEKNTHERREVLLMQHVK